MARLSGQMLLWPKLMLRGIWFIVVIWVEATMTVEPGWRWIVLAAPIFPVLLIPLIFLLLLAPI